MNKHPITELYAPATGRLTAVFYDQPVLGLKVVHAKFMMERFDMMLVERDSYGSGSPKDLAKYISKLNSDSPSAIQEVVLVDLEWLADPKQLREWRNSIRELNCSSICFIPNSLDQEYVMGTDYDNENSARYFSSLTKSFQRHPMEFDTCVVLEGFKQYQYFTRFKNRGEREREIVTEKGHYLVAHPGSQNAEEHELQPGLAFVAFDTLTLSVKNTHENLLE